MQYIIDLNVFGIEISFVHLPLQHVHFVYMNGDENWGQRLMKIDWFEASQKQAFQMVFDALR